MREKERKRKRHQTKNQLKWNGTMETFPKLFFYIIIITTAFSFLLLHVSADDAAVMSQLAKSITPTPRGWTGNNPCTWSGINCDSSGRVSSISLASRFLSGQLPPDLNQLSSLETLYLQRNMLTGTLPSFENLDSLQEILLDGNNFTSISPKFLSGLRNLQHFSIRDNENLAPWTIPKSLTDSTLLVSFQASKCGIVGTIPDIFGSFPNLENLRLSYNNLTGSLPPSLAKSGIQHLWLNNQVQGLSGRIDVISTMTQLQQVWLHVNQFSGPIPDLSNCTSLFDLQLRENHLTGVIPLSLTSLPKLANVSLQDNVFQGPVPSFRKEVQVNIGTENSFCNTSPGPCDPQVTILLAVAADLGYPMALAESWKGNDPCRDWKFISCDSKGRVNVINLGKQDFEGEISPAIANLTALKTLLLNDNKLTGSIPNSLTSLEQLQQLDVSNNNISGKIPEFGSHVTLKTNGNPFIGKDLPTEGSEGGGSSSGGSSSGGSFFGGSSSSKSSLPAWLIALIIIIVVIIMVALCLFIYKRYVKKRSPTGKEKRKKDDVNAYDKIGGGSSDQSSNNDMHIYGSGNVAISFDILKEATNNFSEDNILGRGGFGVVYKGKLNDGTVIAVKRMESAVARKKGHSEFQAEIEVLTKVRHRHLVALNGFCDNGNEKLLVYEYMANGTLGQHLFHCKEMGFPSLTWKQRVAIGLDVARGIEYLHSLAQQSFIHRDLKPSNILLGDDMRGKVSDFGLVKNAPDGKYSVETRLAGTFGYLAPEYAATGRVTTKVDVFAFGVVLMEMITGRKALDESMSEEESHLVTWFRKVLSNKDWVRACVDPKLEPNEETFESIYAVAELAGHCTTREPYQRPDMGHAVNVLAPLVEQWKPTSQPVDHSFGIDMSLPQALAKWKSSEDTTMTSDLLDGYSQMSRSSPTKNSTIESSFNSKDAR
ncbi:hypothetical protein LguiB_030871 [Lonicera macranthoides]